MKVTVRSEQRIKDLCSQALEVKDAEDVERVLGELRTALDEHVRHAKVLLASQAFLFQSNDPKT